MKERECTSTKPRYVGDGREGLVVPYLIIQDALLSHGRQESVVITSA